MTKLKTILITALALLTISFPGYAIAQTKGAMKLDSDPSSAYGPEMKRFGLGPYLGEPTGLSLKGYLFERVAADVHAGWTFHDRAFTLMSDLTCDIFDLPIRSHTLTLPFYIGFGGKLEFDTDPVGDTVFGFRFPAGFAIQWITYPAEIFVEVAPGLEVTPYNRFDITAGIGVRFYIF